MSAEEAAAAQSAAPEAPAETPAEAPAAAPAEASGETPAAPDAEVAPKQEEPPVAPAPPPAPEPPKELEEDAKEDKSPKIAEEIVFNTTDTTLNAMPSQHGNLLMMLTDGGMQYLLAGVRANTGIKAGRYLFEVKIVEILDPAEQQGQSRVHHRQHLRLGFSTAGSSLFLGDTEDSVCFDSEGRFTSNRTSNSACPKFNRDQVFGVLLNLDADSPNANTISLFRDGVRVSQPQPLPDNLKGKTLFPTVTFRNVTLSMNVGKEPKADLPFKCRMIGDASKKDAEVAKSTEPKDGMYQVVFPVCLPGEGTFDWADMFLEQHPDYTELSDRMILQWAEKSGINRQRGYKWRNANDEPSMSTGVPELDNLSVRRILRSIASAQKRNFLVMEVKSNLLETERKELLGRFAAPHFKKVAQVLIGDPTSDFKKKSQDLILKAKQEKADLEFKQKKAEEVRKKLAELKEKELAKQQKKVERAAKKAKKEAEAAAKKAEDEKKAEDGEAPKESEPKPDEEMKAAEDDEEEEEEEKDEPMPEADEEKPPAVALSAEEKAQVFRPSEYPDLTASALSHNLNNFSVPVKAEGFDDVKFSWSAKTKCDAYFKEWKLAQKLSTRVEDLKPSEWFNQKNSAWNQQCSTWRQKQVVFKAELAKKNSEAEKKDAAPAEGEAGEAEKKEEQPAEEQKDVAMVSDEDLDVFGVSNVLDLGNGEPLFGSFSFEDWALLTLRVELHLMAHSFRKDVNDAERPGIQIDNLPFYYNKYFRKAFNASNYGMESAEKLLELVKDAISLNEKKVLIADLDEELDNFDLFLKLTEEGRRERELLVDSGEDSAALKFNQTALQAAIVHGGKDGGMAVKGGGSGYYQRGPQQGKGFGPQQGYQQGYGQQGKGFGPQQGNWQQQGKGFAGGGGWQQQGQKGFGGGGGWGGCGGKGGQMGGGGKGGKDQQYGQKRPYNNYGGGGCKGYGK